MTAGYSFSKPLLCVVFMQRKLHLQSRLAVPISIGVDSFLLTLQISVVLLFDVVFVFSPSSSWSVSKLYHFRWSVLFRLFGVFLQVALPWFWWRLFGPYDVIVEMARCMCTICLCTCRFSVSSRLGIAMTGVLHCCGHVPKIGLLPCILSCASLDGDGRLLEWTYSASFLASVLVQP